MEHSQVAGTIFRPKFSRGQSVVVASTDLTFQVGEIDARLWQYDGREVLNVRYRSVRPSPDPEFPLLMIKGKWWHENQLKGAN